MSTRQYIGILPSTDQGFIRGLPGIPPNTSFATGARIEGEVRISLPLLGVPASAVEIQLQKSETIQIDGQENIVTVDQLNEIILWPNSGTSKSTDIYSMRFPFSIRIPEDLPPTVSFGKPGLKVQIQYLLHATVYRENRIKFWSEKPFTCTLPITITKYEHHPAWPIYHRPEPKNTFKGSMRFTVRPARICYSPGETIRLISELSCGSYCVTPRNVDFEVRLQRLITISGSSESRRQPHQNGQFNKQPTVELISRQITSSPRVGHAATFTAELTCSVPLMDINPTLTDRSHIQAAYVLVVTVVVHAERLQIDTPVIISPFTSPSSTVELQNIGSVSSLGGTPHFGIVSQALPDTAPADTISEREEDKEISRFSGTTSESHTAFSDDQTILASLHDNPTIKISATGSNRSSAEGLARTRKSRSTGTLDNFEFDIDYLAGLNQEISASWFTEPGESLISRLIGIGKSSELPVVDFMELLGDLTTILQSPEKTKALLELRGDQAQVVVDFLDSVLVALDPSKTRLRKHILIMLYRLCKASHCYPEYYTLRNITIGPQEAAGGFCDIYRGRYRDQVLCLKVVRIFRKADSETAVKLFAKEAILWGQLNHPNILPFYGIYYFGKEHRMCLVSPWMENGNLVNYLQENPTVDRRPFVYDVAIGLEYLHEKNVIHGDLKGVNVLVTSFGRACITDFGLSSVRIETSNTEALTSRPNGGTYRWVAPELLDDSDSRPSRASDVWAFGCLCYQILTRRVPFHEISSDTAIVGIVLKGRTPSQTQNNDPASTLDVIDDGMWSLLKLCWSFKPDDRPTCRRIMEILGIEGLVDHRSPLAYDQITEFRSAMRERASFPLNLMRITALFNEIKRTKGEQTKLPISRISRRRETAPS